MPPDLVVPLTPPSDRSRSVATFLESPATRFNFKRQSGLPMEMPSAERLKVYDFPDEATTISVQSLIGSDAMEEKIKVSLEPTREFQSIQGLSDKLDFFIEELEATNEKLDETTEKLDKTTEKLDKTTGKLDETTEKLDDTTEMLNETREVVNSHRVWIRNEGKAKLPMLKFNALADFVHKIYMINNDDTTTTEGAHSKKSVSQPAKGLNLGSQTQDTTTTTVTDHSLSTTHLIIQAAENITKEMLQKAASPPWGLPTKYFSYTEKFSAYNKDDGNHGAPHRSEDSAAP
ncbi:MAG: hypothetical protein Q9212_007515 [Teloschistes hypoglaucus]